MIRVIHTLPSNCTPVGTFANGSLEITQGWTASPSGRGTIDIIWSCMITMFLSSWSVLCLQVPAEGDSRFIILWRRLWLTLLCGLGPEFTFQLALGEWSSARRSVKDFRAAGYRDWTTKHAFYADSGGFFLYTPDFKPIPIDAKQLLYLIEHKYIDYPTVSEKNIDDKNKVDVLLRFISLLQTLWFSTTLIARGAQGLAITGLELTTAAFILCSFGSTYCWWHKAADVGAPTALHTQIPMATILKDAGDAVLGPYHRTPLDFISIKQWHWSLYWTHWINILRKMHIVFAPKELPHNRIENTLWREIKTKTSLAVFALLTFAYSAIYIAGWDTYFSTQVERILWRISSLSMMATICLYFLITGFAYAAYPALYRLFHPQADFVSQSPTAKILITRESSNNGCNSVVEISTPTLHDRKPANAIKARSRLSLIVARIRNNSVLRDPSLDVPLKATLPIYVVAFLYCCSRTLLLVLDMTQLRSMPASAFDSVNWSAFIPHL